MFNQIVSESVNVWWTGHLFLDNWDRLQHSQWTLYGNENEWILWMVLWMGAYWLKINPVLVVCKYLCICHIWCDWELNAFFPVSVYFFMQNNIEKWKNVISWWEKKIKLSLESETSTSLFISAGLIEMPHLGGLVLCPSCHLSQRASVMQTIKNRTQVCQLTWPRTMRLTHVMPTDFWVGWQISDCLTILLFVGRNKPPG